MASFSFAAVGKRLEEIQVDVGFNYWKSLNCVLILCDPMGYAVCGILQARILEWVAVPFSRGSSQPRGRTQVSCLAGGFFTSWATRESQFIINHLLMVLYKKGYGRCWFIVRSPVSVILLFCLLLNTWQSLLPFLEMQSYAFSVISVFVYGVSDYMELLFRMSLYFLHLPNWNNLMLKKKTTPKN